MLKYNTYRALRYLRSVFVEGTYLLASEATNIQLEALEISKEIARKYIGNSAISEGWKVEKISNTEVLIKKGEGWYDGIPFVLRSNSDPLVTLGIDETGVASLSDYAGGKKLTFGPTTATGTYRIVITAREELVTSIQDPFLVNANLNEATSQKIRLKYQVNVVLDSDQSESPIPYKNESTDFNLANSILITSNSGGTGELLATSTIAGASNIDGRDIEIKIKNYTTTIPFNNVLPTSSSDQPDFTNGTLIDNNGERYHINIMFNDTDSSVIVIRLDKQVGQSNPVISNGSTFRVNKRSVFAASDVSGTPQGKLYWPIAKVTWDSGILHQSSVEDLRSVVSDITSFQKNTNVKFGLRTTGGGVVSYDTLANPDVFKWTQNFSIINPHGPECTVAAGEAFLVEDGSLAYNINFTTGGTISLGELAVTISSHSGTTVNLSAVNLSSVRLGNVLFINGNARYIVSIDDINNTVEVDSALVDTGAAKIYLDSFGPSLAPLSENTFILASRKGNKIWIGPTGQELEVGETSSVGDGLADAILTYIGSPDENDSTPSYSSAEIVTQSGNLTQAIGELDAEIDDINQVLVRSTDITLTGISDQDIIVESLGTGNVDIRAAGTGSVLIESISISNDTITNSSGNVVIESLTINNNNITNVSGSVEIESLSINDNAITNSSGGVVVESITIDNNNITNASGSVQIESVSIENNVITGGNTTLIVQSDTNQDLSIQAQGTGKVVIETVELKDNTITGTSGSTLYLKSGLNQNLEVSAEGTGSVLVENITIKDSAITGPNSSSLDLKSGTNQDLILDTQGIGLVDIKANIKAEKTISILSESDSVSGSNATLATPTKSFVRLTNSGLVSIDMIPAGVEGQKLTLSNNTGVQITINNNSGATAANRILTGSGSALDIPDSASVELIYNLTESRWTVVGISSSGGGGTSKSDIYIAKADYFDGTSTTLPTGSVVIDGKAILNNDLVLFTNLSVDNNKIYSADVSGGLVTTWNVVTAFASTSPVDGDSVYVRKGNAYADNIFRFDGAEFFNVYDVKKTLTFLDNTTTGILLSFDKTLFDYATLEYSFTRGTSRTNQKVYLTHDSSTVYTSSLSGVTIGTSGLSLNYYIVSNDLVITYSTTSTGLNGIFSYTLRLWK